MNTNNNHNNSIYTSGLHSDKSLLLTAVAALFLIVTAPSAEAINKCVDSGGNVTYQEDTCPEDTNHQDLKLPQLSSMPGESLLQSGPAAEDSSEDATILELVSVISTYEMCSKVSPSFAGKNASTFNAWNTQNASTLAHFEKSERYQLLLSNGRLQSAQQMQMPGARTQLSKFCDGQFASILNSTIQP